MNIGDADFYEAMTEGLHVGSWCPTPLPTVPPTQVHLTVPSSLGKVLLRFKPALARPADRRVDQAPRRRVGHAEGSQRLVKP